MKLGRAVRFSRMVRMELRGEKQAVMETLNQIHWRSLKARGGINWKEKGKVESKSLVSSKTYVQVLKEGNSMVKSDKVRRHKPGKFGNILRIRAKS
ncbi:hypothetical protein AgCh_018117 [Apium graveolens]